MKLRLKIRSFISRLHARTSSSASVAPELPPERWMQIWLLLVEDPDDAVRNVARQARQIHAGPCTQPAVHSLCVVGCLTPRRFHVCWQAFTSNPQRILTHARWLVEKLQSNTDSSWSTAKAEVLRLFATLQARLTPPSFGLRHHCRHLFLHYHQPSSNSSSTTHLRPRCRRSLSSSR